MYAHEKHKTQLKKEKQETQRQIGILHSIYKIIPMIALQVDVKASTYEELNEKGAELFEGRDHNSAI